MGRTKYNPAWEKNVGRVLVPVANEIAAAAERNADAAQDRFDDLARRYGPVTAVPRGDRALVFTESPWAPIVEWGTFRNDPAAPMRDAASKFGKFVEASK